MPKRAFRVVTDSTADLPPDWADRYGIEVVPLKVIFGNESFQDGVDLTGEQFFERLSASEALPTTSAPAPGEFAEVYRRLRDECDGVISIHIGSTLSGTAEAARVGAASVEGFPVRVVDSGTTTMPVAFLCRIAAMSASLDEAVAAVEQRISRTRVLALLDTLKFLEKGGRIGKAQYLVGSLLDFKPILRLADGEVKPADRVRTRRKAITRLAELLRMDLPVENVAVMYATDPEDAQELRATLARELSGVEVEFGQIGAVLGTHTGPRAMGLVYIRATDRPGGGPTAQATGTSTG